jgi:choline dehydrogenase-like flavoprotein
VKWIGKDGYRSTAARHYIYNKPRPNLTILSRKTVSKVLIEDGVAVGVEICDAPSKRGDIEIKNVQTIKARRQVVVSAGALSTPCILERSGAGNPEILSKMGVEAKVDLPGVGKEYQDHQVGLCQRMKRPFNGLRQSIVEGYKIKDLDGLDAFAKRDPEAVEKAQEQWKKDGTGVLSTTVLGRSTVTARQHRAHLQTTFSSSALPTPRSSPWVLSESVAEIGTDHRFAEMWSKVGQNNPDKPLVTGGKTIPAMSGC